ncbi:MAG: RimK family alpha-L-glutamate ligase [Lachnospiraceae bacterium]|nr:RimK family alpha-L-glutamate ligase [Lachnospiraceae bacterium]
MKGLLIVNAFLNSPQVRSTYDALLAGAKRAGIDMRLMTNADFFVRLDDALVRALPDRDPKGTDFILFWNKDVFLGRALERMGYRLYNCADAIEACDNKALTFEMLQGICRMPKTVKIPMTFNTIGYDDLSFEEYIGSSLGYPYVIKECLGSYGGQVYLASTPDKAHSILKMIEGKDCIAQEFIGESKGRDLRAYVVGGRVVAAMERRNDRDFRSNIANGGKSYPIDISPEQERLAVDAAHGLGLDFAGVDILFGKNDEPILCEVNSNAQFAALLAATGIDVTDHIYSHIKSLIS